MNKAKFKFGDKAFYDNFLVVVLGVNQTPDNEFEYFVVDEKCVSKRHGVANGDWCSEEELVQVFELTFNDVNKKLPLDADKTGKRETVEVLAVCEAYVKDSLLPDNYSHTRLGNVNFVVNDDEYFLPDGFVFNNDEFDNDYYNYSVTHWFNKNADL